MGIHRKGIARSEGLVIFVEGAIPGDVVDIEIYKKRRKHAEARIIRFVNPSPDRIEPICEHFGICGGCNLQNMNYHSQLVLKQKIVTNAFTHIGKLDIAHKTNDIAGSVNIYFYRNKMEFSFSSNKWLTNEEINSGLKFENRNAAGFHIPGKFDKILDINKCYLQSEPSNEIRIELKSFCESNQLSFYNIREGYGFLRSLLVRTTTTGEVMVIVIFGENQHKQISLTMKFLLDRFPVINSSYYMINQKKNDSLNDLEAIHFGKESIIQEKIGDIRFRIGPKTFFQTNPLQAAHLFKMILDIGQFSPSDHLYDLYCGVGTISLFLSGFVKKVTGIDSVGESVNEARNNADFNHINNTVFIEGEVEKIMVDSFYVEHGKPDCIIVDPPRAGLHPDVIKSILISESPKMIYISCNPATQARDISLLSEKYEIDIIQPVDMFPQTLHVENIALLKLRKDLSV